MSKRHIDLYWIVIFTKGNYFKNSIRKNKSNRFETIQIKKGFACK